MRAWLILLLVFTACYVKPVDFTDKSCPCAPGYSCVEDRCVLSTDTDADGDTDTDVDTDVDVDGDGDGDSDTDSDIDGDGDGDGDGDVGADGDIEPCMPLMSVEGFQADWAASASIRWEWEPGGLEENFLAYELVIGESIEDVENREGTARVFTALNNPELGTFLLPRTDSAGDLVRGTITDGLTPSTSYIAQLVVIDTSLCEFKSPVSARATHVDPPEEIVIFRDSVPHGSYALPSNFLPAEDDDGSGYHLLYLPADDPECSPSSTICGNNLRYQDLNIDLSRISAGAFASTALFEFELSVDSESSSFWSEAGLAFESCAGRYTLNPWTMPPRTDGAIVQFPLRVLMRWVDDDDVPLDHGVLTSGPLCGFRIFGQWNRDATVRIDEIRIRY